MNRYLFLQLLLLFSYKVNSQCAEIEQAITYIESSIVSDMFYFWSWEPEEEDMNFIKLLEKEGVIFNDPVSKEDIREPLIWYMEEKIPFDINKNNNPSSVEKVNITKNIKIPNQTTTQQRANYLLFTSDICDGKLLIKLLHNRDSSFNLVGGKTEYEKWSRMNGGMVYLFQFNGDGCFVNVLKEFEFNE